MEKKNDGGSAFPASGQNGSVTYDADGRAIHRPFISAQPGMSLRDYLAGQALSGLVSSEHNWTIAQNATQENDAFMAQAAYELADAMLRDREK